ncbi:phosphoribosylglycinamide formyltransferase 2 [Philodulcilactobacillus myokoensis]|uniref:Phosphoribosylglycinamide formyltransferase 2 n=1 Tax=Philodulcilactobacillus myokoensis TaxID=2929573 RepID=A0A9W6ESD1_9LACO|nr:ATP-grasp domain-containing protein [Philodulcilactobacillus myokoensis]GLB46640.1 phosphoribosylglycinamide formyltransferase 2 [Philodulcilactobacillus myokoensis]
MINKALQPGDTIGIIGESIGNIHLIMEAKQLGFYVGIYTPIKIYHNQLADFCIIGDLGDKQKLKVFAKKCDIVTYSSANISSNTIKYMEQYTNVPQHSTMLDMIQDRLIKQSFFDQINVNTAPYETVVNLNDLYHAINSIGYPAILRPIQRDFNHGKQLLIKNQLDIAKADILLNYGTYVLESYIPHNKTFSVISANNSSNHQSVSFPIIQNEIVNGKIQTAFSPTTVDPLITDELKRIARKITNNIQYDGIIEISLILGSNDNIYVHNVNPFLSTSSFIFDHANINEFQMYLRAISGMPLTKIKLSKPTILQSFNQNQWRILKKQWPFPNNWQFIFYNRIDQNLKNVQGHILIESNSSVKNVLKDIKNTKAWD